MTPVSGILRLANVQWHHVASKCPVAPVTPSHAQSRPVTPSGNRCQQVSTGVNRWHLVAVRSHFGLRLDGRNNPARASNRPGRRIKGWWASTGLGKTPRSRYRGGFAPPNPPPGLLIVSDILDSEIHDRTRVLYSYSYLRGSYEIEADLTMH